MAHHYPVGGNDDVDGEEEEDVGEANIFVSEASKPSAEASEILV